jgi:hypothetical protein
MPELVSAAIPSAPIVLSKNKASPLILASHTKPAALTLYKMFARIEISPAALKIFAEHALPKKGAKE